MALTRGTTGSLWPSFDSARLVSLAVWRAYAIALDERFPTALSPPIARLRYHLGGDRPSQTTHHAGSRIQVHGPRLDISDNKGGISHFGSTKAGASASKPPAYATHVDANTTAKL